MEELKKMSRVVEREYPEAQFLKLIVLDATTGQNASSQVETFDNAIGLDGVVLTKLDGTAKGGFVLSMLSENCVPVAYVGVGEKLGDLEEFDLEEFVDGLF
jgi:fused signal recognition particle receptor